MNTNINEKININNLIFTSNPLITKNGFYNNYEFIIKNINSDSKIQVHIKMMKIFIYRGYFNLIHLFL